MCYVVWDDMRLYISKQQLLNVFIRYSGHEIYAKSFYCDHPENSRKRLKVRFAFQLRIKPGSYGIGPETIGATRKGNILDANFRNEELEWYTKQNMSIVLYGLLLNVSAVQKFGG